MTVDSLQQKKDVAGKNLSWMWSVLLSSVLGTWSDVHFVAQKQREKKKNEKKQQQNQATTETKSLEYQRQQTTCNFWRNPKQSFIIFEQVRGRSLKSNGAAYVPLNKIPHISSCEKPLSLIFHKTISSCVSLRSIFSILLAVFSPLQTSLGLPLLLIFALA